MCCTRKGADTGEFSTRVLNANYNHLSSQAKEGFEIEKPEISNTPLGSLFSDTLSINLERLQQRMPYRQATMKASSNFLSPWKLFQASRLQ